MSYEVKVLLGVVVAAWVLTSFVVAKTSSLRTYLKWVDGFLAFPVAMVMLPLCVYLAEELAPYFLGMSHQLKHQAIRSVSAELRHAAAVTCTLFLIGPIPGFLYWSWRRHLHRREKRILAGRQAVP